MAIFEPTTLLTDYLLGIWAGFLAGRMITVRLEPDHAPRYWAFALAATAFASFAGGTYHGFGPAMASRSAALLWKGTTLAMGLASFFLTASAVFAAFSRPIRGVLLAAAAIKLAIYAWWMMSHDMFVYVIYDYGSALVFVLILAGASRLHGEPRHRVFIAGGIVISIVAALLQQSGLRIHTHFNHNDLMHVVQIVAVYLLYQGGRRLHDAPGR